MICKMSISTISPSARGGQGGVFYSLISIFCKLLINNVLQWVIQEKLEWDSDDCVPQIKCIGSKITNINWEGKMWYVKCKMSISTISPSARGGQGGVFYSLISIFCKLLINNVLQWVIQEKLEWDSDDYLQQMKCFCSKITNITWEGKMWYVKCRVAQYPLLQEGAKRESLIC